MRRHPVPPLPIAAPGSVPVVRVIVFIHAFGPGGVERIALRLAKGWHDDGADVRLIVGQDRGPMRSEPGGLRTITAAPWPLVGHGLRVLRLVAEVRRAVQAQRPDVLFCPGNTYTLAAVSLRLLLWHDCPPIVTKISNDLIRRDLPAPVRGAYRLWLLVQGRLIHRFVALSAAMAAETQGRLGVPAARVTVMPNPVLALADLAEDTPPRPHTRPSVRQSGAARRFVAVGRLERQKDYPLMLRAFARGSRPADTLCIIGEGSARAALQQLAGTLGIASRVQFDGFRADIPTALRAHDVLLLSSRFEGQPGAVVEALAAGLAIVATRCSTSMAPLLDDGVLGDLVAVGDIEGFADAIAQAAPDMQDTARAHRQARRFTIEAAVPAYLAWFATLADVPTGGIAPGAAMTARAA